jgi:hypothetical protein
MNFEFAWSKFGENKLSETKNNLPGKIKGSRVDIKEI